MATLQIRKKATKTWLHVPSDHKQYIVSKLYCKFNGDMFRVIEWGGRQRAEYHFSDITVYDDTQGGAPETFGSAVALMLRLEALEYIGFPLGSGSGGVGFQPTIVNPLNGQTLIYNSTTGIWHNGYIDVEGNRFLQIVEIPPAVGNVLTIPIGFIWVILNDTYSLLDNWVEEIPYTSEEGMIRKDIIVAIAGNNMIRIEGQESDTNPLEPTVPPNTLLVTQIDVFHDSIGEPTEPIIGDLYIPKSTQGWVNWSMNPTNLVAPVNIGAAHSIALAATVSGHVVTGLNITQFNNPIWHGGYFALRVTGLPVTLKHLGSPGKIVFNFRTGEDVLLTKDDGVLFFKLSAIPATGTATAYCLNDKVGGSGGDFMTLNSENEVTEDWSITNGDQSISFDTNELAFRIENDAGTVLLNTEEGVGLSYARANGDYVENYTNGIRGSFLGYFWSIAKLIFDTDISQVLLPQTGNTERRLAISVNGEFADENGNIEIETGGATADQVSYDNTASGLLAETVQEAVDELSGHITQLYETKEDRVSVVPITANTTISALHHGKILLITADVVVTFPTGLGAGFTGCAFRIATGGKMTPAFASGVTRNDFFADYNPGESLYVFKESDSTNVFYAV